VITSWVEDLARRMHVRFIYEADQELADLCDTLGLEGADRDRFIQETRKMNRSEARPADTPGSGLYR